jgi:EF hand
MLARPFSLGTAGVDSRWRLVAKEGDLRLFLIGIAMGLVFFFAVILPAARQAQPQPIQAQQLDVDTFIHRWDADHDGTINRDELRKATDNRLRDKLVDKLFQVGDKDGDGRIDKSELNSLAHESFLWMFEVPPEPAS